MNKSNTFKISIIMGICAVFLFIKYIAQLFPSLIGSGLMKHYALSALDLGVLASSYYYSYSFMQVVSGWLLDQFNIRWVAASAIAILALSLILFSENHSFLILCLSRVMMGVGASFATVLYLKCAAAWTTPKTFGIVASFLATATMLGAAFGGAPLAYFFQAFTWQHVLVLVGLFSLLLAVLCAILISDVRKQDIVLRDTVAFSHLKSIFLKRENFLLMVYSGMVFAPIIIMGGLWGTPFLVLKYHLSTEQVSYLLSIMFIGIAIGGPFWSLIGVYFQNRHVVMQLANLFSLLAICCIIYGSFSYGIEAIWFFMLGFTVGCFMFSFTICKEINPIGLLGFAFAFMNTGEGIIASLVEPTIGRILDIEKGHQSVFTLTDYHQALILVPICFIFASAALAILKRSIPQYFVQNDIANSC